MHLVKFVGDFLQQVMDIFLFNFKILYERKNYKEEKVGTNPKDKTNP